MTTEPQTAAPLTEAGRRLLASLHAQAPVHVPIEQDAASILAIEREAATRARSGLDAGLREAAAELARNPNTLVSRDGVVAALRARARCQGCEVCVGEVDDCGCVIGHEHTCAALAPSGEAAPTTPDDYTVARYLREEAGEAAPVDGLRAAAPLLVRICDAMSHYPPFHVTLPHVRGVAGIGSTTATEAEWRGLARLVDEARALLAREEADDDR